jgi:hypothetical protein
MNVYIRVNIEVFIPHSDDVEEEQVIKRIHTNMKCIHICLYIYVYVSYKYHFLII